MIFAGLYTGCNIPGFRSIGEVMTPESNLQRNAEDSTLAVAAAAGQRDALGELYRRHRAAVHRVAYAITGSLHDAEDVLQDVFVGLPRALRRYEETGRFESWLKRVAARTALMRLRRARRRVPPLDFVRSEWLDQTDTLVQRLDLREALRVMKPKLRVVFVLREVEGHSHAEIAELLGISSAASRVRHHRAWNDLRRKLEVDR